MDNKLLRAIDLAEVDLAFARAELSFAGASTDARERAVLHLAKVARRLNKLFTAKALKEPKNKTA